MNWFFEKKVNFFKDFYFRKLKWIVALAYE